MTYPVVFLKVKDNLSRYEFGSGNKISVGRDTSCDICINLPHISGFHLEFGNDMFGEIVCLDTSTNGTFIGSEKLPSGSPYVLGRSFAILDLRLGVELAVCHSSEQEEVFLKSIRHRPTPEQGAQVDKTQSQEKSDKKPPKEGKSTTSTPKATSRPNTEKRERKPTMVIKVKRFSPEATYVKKQMNSNTIMLSVVLLLGLAYLGVIFGREIGNYLSSMLESTIPQIVRMFGS